MKSRFAMVSFRNSFASQWFRNGFVSQWFRNGFVSQWFRFAMVSQWFRFAMVSLRNGFAMVSFCNGFVSQWFRFAKYSKHSKEEILSWLEAYTRRENVRIFNVKEEVDENTEVVMRNLLVTKMQIPLEKVQSIRFERATPHF